MTEIKEKTCSKCKQVKPMNDFHRLTKAKDGHYFRCRACQEAIRQARKDEIEEIEQWKIQQCLQVWRDKYNSGLSVPGWPK